MLERAERPKLVIGEWAIPEMYLVSSPAWQAHFQNCRKLKQSIVLRSAYIQAGYPAKEKKG